MFRGKAKIFVEGVADKRFLEEYLAYLYGVRPERNDVISCDGWTNVGRETCVNQMRRNTDDGGENLLVFDADLKPCERRVDIETMVKANNLSCQLFLLPDNSNPGALEELLISAMNPVNKPVCDCWKRYEEDLSRQAIPWKNPPHPTIPAKKTQIYAYLEALLGETRQEKTLIKEVERHYTNENHWNLAASGLAPLREFLETFFGKANM